MSEAYVGEIRAFGFNFAPVGWFLCNGQTLPISSYTALFSIIGTTYGGNGTSTFQLPNLQGQIPMHWGTGPGGFTTVIGEVQGQPTVSLLQSNLPVHNHLISGAVTAQGAPASQRVATPSANAYMGASASPERAYQTAGTPLNTTLNGSAIGLAGGSTPHDNMQPYLVLNFCIAYEGVFPSRS